MLKAKHNPLASYIYDSISFFSEEMKHKISHWHVMVVSHNVNIETFDKRKISINGFDYSGTLVSLYWSFFDPFIKDYISNTSEEIRQKSIDSCIDAEDSLEIFRVNMQNTVEEIYKEISKTDRLMRGKGFPEKVTLRSVDNEIRHMCQCLDEKVNNQIEIANKQKWNKRKEFILGHMNWWLLIVALFICWLCEVMEWTDAAKWFDKIYEKL